MAHHRGISYLLRRTYLTLNREFRAAITPIGLTPDQYVVLYLLAEEDGLNQRQIADRMPSDSSTVTGVLSRMEQRGWLTRRRSESDGRSICVFLTHDGRQLLERGTAVAEELRERALDDLDDEDRERLRELLGKIEGALVDRDGSPSLQS